MLQDTQRLSDLRVADGDTLHMVQRLPVWTQVYVLVATATLNPKP